MLCCVSIQHHTTANKPKPVLLGTHSNTKGHHTTTALFTLTLTQLVVHHLPLDILEGVILINVLHQKVLLFHVQGLAVTPPTETLAARDTDVTCQYILIQQGVFWILVEDIHHFEACVHQMTAL